MANYSLSAVNWAGQEPGTSGTSSVNNGAARGDRNASRRAAKSAKNMPQPLSGPPAPHATSGFELVNVMTSALLAGDGQAATALIDLGSLASQSIATGRLAARERGR